MSGATKTATAREVQRHLAAILDRVAGGEEVTVTRHGKVVARIIPARASKRMRWPDFSLSREARTPEPAPARPARRSRRPKPG